jgi:hypothetical protein
VGRINKQPDIIGFWDFVHQLIIPNRKTDFWKLDLLIPQVKSGEIFHWV